MEPSLSRFSVPSWAPDGKKVVVTEEAAARSKTQFGMLVVDIEDGTFVRLSKGQDGQWAPKENLIVFLDRARKNAFLTSDDGSMQRKQFSHGWQNPLLSGPLLWSPEGEKIGFHYGFAEGRAFAFYLYDVRRKKKREIFSRSQFFVVAWARGRSENSN
jgi:hypothetical protein